MSVVNDLYVKKNLFIDENLSLTKESNQVLFSHMLANIPKTTTINIINPTADSIYTIPDVGVAANFVLDKGAQTIAGLKTFTSNLKTTTNDIQLGATNILTLSGTVVASSTYTIPDVGVAANFVLNAGNSLINGNKEFMHLFIQDFTTPTYRTKLVTDSTTAMTADRILILDVNNADREVVLSGNINISNNFTTSGNFALTLTQTATTSITLPTTGTLATLANAETFTNKTITATSNTITSNNLRTSGGGSVAIDSTTPSNTQILIATASTTATWQKNKGALGILPLVNASASTYTVQDTDCIIVCKYSQTGTQTITLPNAATIDVGKTYHIVDASGNSTINNITVTAAGGNINGVSSVVINTDHQGISVFSDGSNWYIY